VRIIAPRVGAKREMGRRASYRKKKRKKGNERGRRTIESGFLLYKSALNEITRNGSITNREKKEIG